jgi:hypothetical protein
LWPKDKAVIKAKRIIFLIEYFLITLSPKKIEMIRYDKKIRSFEL